MSYLHFYIKSALNQVISLKLPYKIYTQTTLSYVQVLKTFISNFVQKKFNIWKTHLIILLQSKSIDEYSSSLLNQIFYRHSKKNTPIILHIVNKQNVSKSQIIAVNLVSASLSITINIQNTTLIEDFFQVIKKNLKIQDFFVIGKGKILNKKKTLKQEFVQSKSTLFCIKNNQVIDKKNFDFFNAVKNKQNQSTSVVDEKQKNQNNKIKKLNQNIQNNVDQSLIMSHQSSYQPIEIVTFQPAFTKNQQSLAQSSIIQSSIQNSFQDHKSKESSDHFLPFQNRDFLNQASQNNIDISYIINASFNSNFDPSTLPKVYHFKQFQVDPIFLEKRIKMKSTASSSQQKKQFQDHEQESEQFDGSKSILVGNSEDSQIQLSKFGDSEYFNQQQENSFLDPSQIIANGAKVFDDGKSEFSQVRKNKTKNQFDDYFQINTHANNLCIPMIKIGLQKKKNKIVKNELLENMQNDILSSLLNRFVTKQNLSLGHQSNQDDNRSVQIQQSEKSNEGVAFNYVININKIQRNRKCSLQIQSPLKKLKKQTDSFLNQGFKIKRLNSKIFEEKIEKNEQIKTQQQSNQAKSPNLFALLKFF